MNYWYGIHNNYVNVDNICFSKLLVNHIITIPSGDTNRSMVFGDPIFGFLKKILILNFDGNVIEYDETYEITIDLINKEINCKSSCPYYNQLIQLQTLLHLEGGTFKEELPEQKMAIKYLTGKERVLEIGANIGRNSLIIASLLNDSRNLVSIECDQQNFELLNKNKISNHLDFHTESLALSNRRLIQKGWDTIPSESNILKSDYKWVDTITLDELYKKYNLIFDTLVLDCEGAFYYILIDFPEILENIKLIIMENDYKNINHKLYIDDELTKKNFYIDYSEVGGGGPCMSCFYQVWKRV